jgi:hypothetical protein
MNIELDAKTKQAVIEQAKKHLLAEIIAQFDIRQIAGEVKNAAIKEATTLLASELRKKYDEAAVIERAMQSVGCTQRLPTQRKAPYVLAFH